MNNSGLLTHRLALIKYINYDMNIFEIVSLSRYFQFLSPPTALEPPSPRHALYLITIEREKLSILFPLSSFLTPRIASRCKTEETKAAPAISYVRESFSGHRS